MHIYIWIYESVIDSKSTTKIYGKRIVIEYLSIRNDLLKIHYRFMVDESISAFSALRVYTHDIPITSCPITCQRTAVVHQVVVTVPDK